MQEVQRVLAYNTVCPVLRQAGSRWLDFVVNHFRKLPNRFGSVRLLQKA
jgi:hypothetical protein